MIPRASHNATTLVLRRTFTADRVRVFRAWITPAALESWFRPRGMSMTVRSLDVRVGGSFRFDLEDSSSVQPSDVDFPLCNGRTTVLAQQLVECLRERGIRKLEGRLRQAFRHKMLTVQHHRRELSQHRSEHERGQWEQGRSPQNGLDCAQKRSIGRTFRRTEAAVLKFSPCLSVMAA
jgi:Activator of Hsp90 ATPase homolog 1-like protein